MSCPQPVEELKKVNVDGLKKVVQIGATLPQEQTKALSLLLIEFKDFSSGG